MNKQFYIPLSKGLQTLVDEEDFDRFISTSWWVSPSGNKPYAAGRWSVGSSEAPQYLHRLIASAPADMTVDHVNGNSLDNRRSNLRICSFGENAFSKRWPIGSSGYRGVTVERAAWRAQIRVSGRRRRIGAYATPEAAARAYDDAARSAFGPFAILNFPKRGERSAASSRSVITANDLLSSEFAA